MRALLLCELSSTLILLERAGPGFVAKQQFSTLPDTSEGVSLGGHLGLSATGDRVYVTNRGHDSIAVFAFDGEGLKLLQHVPSGGASPRFFLLLEELGLLLVAHEKDGKITAFAVDGGGLLEPLGQIAEVPGAAFLMREGDGPPLDLQPDPVALRYRETVRA
jgi:6-phosphogluconolactonase